MSEQQAFDILRALFDLGDDIWFTRWARKVAQGRDEEARYWLTVYQQLRKRMA